MSKTIIEMTLKQATMSEEQAKYRTERGIVDNYIQTLKQEEKKEQLYIGCKVIKATPMTRDEYMTLKGEKMDRDTENAPGYKVEYPNGYISWSPKWVFDEAYRLITKDEKKLMSM